MASPWPEAVNEFEAFLEAHGFACERRVEEAVFDNKVLLCARGSNAVRVVSDRGVWFVEITGLAHDAHQWYDAALIRDLLLGPGEDVLSLAEQIGIVEHNWSAISRLFDSADAEEIHKRLDTLRQERARRRFPGLYPAGQG